MPLATIGVSVKDRSTTAIGGVANATIYVYNAQGVFQGSASTDASGNGFVGFSTTDPAATSLAGYRVIIKATNYKTVGTKVKFDPLTLTGTAVLYSVQLVPGGGGNVVDIEVTVVTSSGADSGGNPIPGNIPLSGAQVNIYDAANQIVANGTTNTSGVYRNSQISGTDITGWYAMACPAAGYMYTSGGGAQVIPTSSTAGSVLIELRD